MEVVRAVVRDPYAGLTSPVWFLVLVAAAIVAVWSNHTWLRVLAVLCIVGTVMYRESLLYIFVRVLFDYKAAQQWTDYLVYWSKLTQQEFDCDAGKYHRSDSMLYSERMGKGSNVYTVPAGASWRVVKADGVDAVLWKVMCKQ